MPDFPVVYVKATDIRPEIIKYILARIKSGLLDGTVSAWQINEGTGAVIEDSVGAYDGSISGAVWTTISKSGGYALYFDGNDYVSMGDVLDFGTGSFSVEAWFRPTTLATMRVVNKGNAEATGYQAYGWGISPRSHGAMWWIIGADDVEYILSAGSYTVDQWHHAVMVRDGTTLKAYLNGTLAGTKTGVVGTVDNPAPLTLGVAVSPRTGAYVEYFYGQIDSVYIYNRALTSAEISERYDYGLKARVTGMTEGMKAELYDTADVLKASYTLGAGETQAVLDVSALTFPFSGYFKIYDAATALLLKSDVFTDIWGGDIYEFTTA